MASADPVSVKKKEEVGHPPESNDATSPRNLLRAAAVIEYLSEKKIRCLGTDGPTLGGEDPQQAQTVYWLAATRGPQVIEFLTNVGQLPQRGAFFAFAPIKIEGNHGEYGRALGFY